LRLPGFESRPFRQSAGRRDAALDRVTGVTSDDVVVPSRPDTFCDVPALRREQPTAGPSLERATDQGGRSIMFAALRSTDDLASSSDARLCVATTMFYAVALVAPWHAGVAAIGFMIAIAGRRWHLPDSPSPASSAFVGVTALLAVTAFLPLLLHPVDDHGVKLLAQFCLLPVVAALCWLVPESRSLTASLWAGVTAGAVFAGAAALVQVAALDMSRAVGTEGNAIVFGDLALLMGALSVALVGPAVAWSSRLGPNAERHVALATTAAAIGGAVASLLSGSRGGWLAIAPLAALLVWNRLQASRDRGAPSAPLTVGLRNHTARAAFAAVALLAAVVIAQGMPLDRLGAGVDDITGYVTGDVADSSATAPASTRPAPPSAHVSRRGARPPTLLRTTRSSGSAGGTSSPTSPVRSPPRDDMNASPSSRTPTSRCSAPGRAAASSQWLHSPRWCWFRHGTSAGRLAPATPTGVRSGPPASSWSWPSSCSA
jgi:hypothetical protein